MKKYSSNPLLTQFIKFVFTILFVTHLTACIPPTQVVLSIQPTQIPSRIVKNSTLPFRELWRKANVLLFNKETDLIYIYGDQLIFVRYENSTSGVISKLQVLDAKNGSLLWESSPLSFSINSIVVDNQTLFLILSSKITAYDRLFGDVLWEMPLQGGRTTYLAEVKNDILFVYSDEDNALNGTEELVTRKFDTQSGQLLETNSVEINQEDLSLLFKTQMYEYWSDGNMLWAFNQDRHEMWKFPIEDRITYQPLLTNSTLVFVNGIFSDVFGIDNISGKQNWKYENKIVSNITALDGVIYAIRDNAAVVGIDLKTGEETGYIEVEPQATEVGSRSNAYLVASLRNLLIVYYGDSQELIAFER